MRKSIPEVRPPSFEHTVKMDLTRDFWLVKSQHSVSGDTLVQNTNLFTEQNETYVNKY